MEDSPVAKEFLGVIISEVKSSSRELYPLTKNYPMGLLPVGTKKIIIYQLQSLIHIRNLQKVVVILGEDDSMMRPYIQSQFLPQHHDYPHKIEFFTVKEMANTFAVLKELLSKTKKQYHGYMVLHADTLVGIPLSDLMTFHESKKGDLTLLLKAKRELGEQEKKIPEGEVETEIDNVLMGQNGEVLFMDMVDEVENNGVRIDPSVYLQVKRATFKRALDSKVYILSRRVGQLLIQLSSDQIYEIKPWLIQLLVEHQTNKRLLNVGGKYQEKELKKLNIFAYFCQQDAYIKKISTKKIYETINFDSLIRGPKEKQLLLPNSYSDKMEHNSGHSLLISDNAQLGPMGKIRRSVIGPGCRVGKNVELFNSILLENVELKDNCKITECVLGAGTSVGEGAQLRSTYSERGCRVADSLKMESETLIRND